LQQVQLPHFEVLTKDYPVVTFPTTDRSGGFTNSIKNNIEPGIRLLKICFVGS
jgi:hypothetical protein